MDELGNTRTLLSCGQRRKVPLAHRAAAKICGAVQALCLSGAWQSSFRLIRSSSVGIWLELLGRIPASRSVPWGGEAEPPAPGGLRSCQAHGQSAAVGALSRISAGCVVILVRIAGYVCVHVPLGAVYFVLLVPADSVSKGPVC